MSENIYTMSTKKETSCPFWSPVKRSCSIALDGLFIPTEDHIEIYCKTSDYPFCAQYNGQLDSGVPACSINDRRHFGRYISSHRITLVKTNDSHEQTPVTVLATTIDLSEGGIRVFSAENLTEATTLHFSLDENFPEQLQSGVAEIKWCLPQISSNGFQAGLAFKDDAFITAMSSYLEASH